ncbi:MAG: glyoxalase [Lachnospiraceae bacterium]|jgi:catechol 2,3-dioxygenase-like lactoylglutathione lyase family enzyme|nr:glyoxalase [Lachnospiraceae bacterium]
MKLKNVLIAVEDMKRSIAFYQELFGLEVILDQDGNVIMTEGLVLQDKAVWESFIERNVIPKNNCSELYFEEADIEAFVKKLECYREPIQYVNRLTEHSWGQKVIRFYDPDGNLIEVGTPMGR